MHGGTVLPYGLARARARVLPAALVVAILAPLFALAALTLDVRPAAAATCGAGGNTIGVTPLQSSLYTADFPNNGNQLRGLYEGFRITNNGAAAVNGAWVKVDTFTGGVVTLANAASAPGVTSGEDGIDQLKNLAPGANDLSYFYLNATGVTTTAQTHAIRVYDRRPDLAG